MEQTLKWECNNCLKYYTDKNKLVEKLSRGLFNSIVICPHCKKEGTYNKIIIK